MHTVKVNLIANQEITLQGKTVNVHDIQSVMVEDDRIVDVSLREGSESRKLHVPVGSDDGWMGLRRKKVTQIAEDDKNPFE